jgi:hypothetical protein
MRKLPPFGWTMTGRGFHVFLEAGGGSVKAQHMYTSWTRRSLMGFVESPATSLAHEDPNNNDRRQQPPRDPWHG